MKIIVMAISASESGALSDLTDFYNQVVNYNDVNIEWKFIVSTPNLHNENNISVDRYSWVKKCKLFRLFFDLFTTRKILKSFKPDLIISFQINYVGFNNAKTIYFLNNALPFSQIKFSIKDSAILWLYQNIYSKIIIRNIKKSYLVIVQTEALKKTCTNLLPTCAHKIVVYKPNVYINTNLKFEYNDRHIKRFIYPANPIIYKNHMTLLYACNELSKSKVDYCLYLTITGNENKLSRKIKKYCDKNNLNVVFLGSIKREVLYEYYSNSILIFPSFLESYGLPLIEAMNVNSFIISTTRDFSKEILNCYNNVFLFDYNDYIKLSRIMIDISTGKITHNENTISLNENRSVVSFILRTLLTNDNK